MAEEDRCVHELAPGTCSICKVKTEPHLSECQACGELVIWVWSEKGKPMPIDAQAGGDPEKARFRKERTEYVEGRLRGIVHYVRRSELEANTRPLYTCHFDTCKERKRDGPERSAGDR